MAVGLRSRRLREDLHVAVAAAMVGQGDGAAAQQLDRALAPAPAAGQAASRVEDPEEPTRRPTRAELDFAENTKAEAMRMWGV